MPHRSRAAKPALILTLCLLAGASAGCQRADPFTGRRILADLEHARILIPDGSGAAPVIHAASVLPDSGPITLADLLSVAEAHSPDLAASESGIGIAAGQAWQASLYPNPRVELSTEDLSWRRGPSDAKTTVGFTQPIVLGDRLRAARNAAEAEQAAQAAELESRRRILFGEVAVLHSRLIAIREQQRLFVELRGLVNSTLETAQARFEAKAAPETDVIRPRVELHRLDAALARLQQESLAAAKELSLLLGDDPIDLSRLEGAISLTPDALDLSALEGAVRRTHPSLAVADREIEAAAARLQLVNAERTPDLDVRVGVGYNAEIESGVVDVGVGMTVPLWDARQGDALSARFGLARARQERAGIETGLLRRLASAAGEYEAARAQLDTFRDRIVPDAERAFGQTSEGYRGGRTTFLEMLDAQRTLTEARVTLNELASAVAASWAKIIQIVGPEWSDSHAAAPAAAHEVGSPTNHERPEGAETTP